MKITATEITRHLTTLEETPRILARHVSGIEPASLYQSPGNRNWSLNEILAHLRACAELWQYSIYAMLTHDQPTLALLDERRWAKAAKYAALDFHKSLQSFTLQREELLLVLRDLSEEGWSRSATIEGRKHTVFSQSRRMALHESEHLHQIEAYVSLLTND